MPSVKIKDLRSNESGRRNKLWECLGARKIDIWKMRDGRGVFFVIMDKENCQKILEKEEKELFALHGFEIFNPPDLNSNRTIVIRNLDRQIDDWPEERIKEYIAERNEWMKVETVIKLPTTSKMLKVKCEKETMADRAIKDGIYVCYQYIRPEFIEKEIFVRITPCYNCFKYNHLTKECPEEKQIICTICSEKDHNQDLCNKEPKCINCAGPHRTLAAVCPIRKDLIKEKSKAIRSRNRSQSRSQSRARQTYADAARPRPQQQQPQQAYEMPKVPDNIAAVAYSATAYSFFMEMIHPGTFQENMDKIYKLNGIPLVKFPTDIDTEGLHKFFGKTKEMPQQQEPQAEPEQQRDQGATPEGAIALDELLQTARMESQEESTKRARAEMESPTDAKEEEKKIRVERPGVSKLKAQKPPPMPAPPKEKRPTRESRPTMASTSSTASTRPKESKESRAESLTRLSISPQRVKEMDIRVYVPVSAQHNNSPEGIKKIMKHLMEGKAKLTWNHPEADRRHIIKAILQGIISNEDCKYIALKDEDYRTMQEGHIPLQTKRHSSTTYDI